MKNFRAQTTRWTSCITISTKSSLRLNVFLWETISTVETRVDILIGRQDQKVRLAMKILEIRKRFPLKLLDVLSPEGFRRQIFNCKMLCDNCFCGFRLCIHELLKHAKKRFKIELSISKRYSNKNVVRTASINRSKPKSLRSFVSFEYEIHFSRGTKKCKWPNTPKVHLLIKLCFSPHLFLVNLSAEGFTQSVKP